MRAGAIFRKQEVYVAAACMASHANNAGQGFRQRDVKFLIELFRDWSESPLAHPEAQISNTQVARYLDALVAEGCAQRLRKRTAGNVAGKAPTYLLSRIGLLELLNRIVPGAQFIRAEQFTFVFYFIANYRNRILKTIELEGKQFPNAIRLEVAALLDLEALLYQQTRHAELQLQKLDAQIRDATRGAKLARELFASGASTIQTAQEVQKVYPYQLSSQKPLSQLMGEIPADLARFELEFGGLRRIEDLWRPIRALLLAHLQHLGTLKQRLDDRGGPASRS